MNLPGEKQKTFDSIVADLKNIDDVVAIVLGGSYATGCANESSDLDIGIYYHEDQPFAIEEIKFVAEQYSINDNPTVTDFYQWGAWVNGGAWIQTATGKVDLLYRNIEQVKATIEKAQNGLWENDYQQQPPYGFSSVIYLAEIECCVPVYDSENLILQFKSEVKDYAPKLKQAIIQQSLWSAEFTIIHAEDFAKKQDIYNTFGCITRAMKNIVDALCALNEIYLIGDKRTIEVIENSTYSPVGFKMQIENIFKVGTAPLTQNISLLKALFQELIIMTNGLYKSLYNFKK